MTREEFYQPAEKRIAELKKMGVNPAKRIYDYRMAAAYAKDKKFKFFLKDAQLKHDDNPLGMELVETKHEWVLNYHNGVKCLSWPKFFNRAESLGKPTRLDDVIALELMAMAYNMDITWKQYNISTCRAEGYDV